MTLTLSMGTDCTPRPDCVPFVDRWATWCSVRNGATLAMLPITSDYMQQTLDAKSRNMVRKASKHYYYHKFSYNNRLIDIYDMNTSTPHRQGKAMTAAYTTKPKPTSEWDLCGLRHRHIFLGGFNSEGRLRAYCNLAVVGDIAIINQILGHVDDLGDGIMNGLIHYIVDFLCKWTRVTHLNYLDLVSCSVGLARFKCSVGFEPNEVYFDI